MAQELDDLSIKQLEVKKRITEHNIAEYEQFSRMYKISKKIGYDIYKILAIALLIELIAFMTFMAIWITPIFLNPETTEENQEFMNNTLPIVMILMVIFITTTMLSGTDQSRADRRKLREIKKAIKYKREVDQDFKADDDIKELVEEHNRLEYKSSYYYNYKTKNYDPEMQKEVFRAIVAFLNKEGGDLLIGITDDRKIIGIKKDLKQFKDSWDKFELNIRDKIKHHIVSETSVDDLIIPKKHEREGKLCCRITVTQSPAPAWFNDNNEQIFFKRDGNRTITLSGKEMYQYIKTHWNN